MICKCCLKDVPHIVDDLCVKCSDEKWRKEKPKTKIPFEWENLYDNSAFSRRVKVFGGWVLSSYSQINNDYQLCNVFIPDPNHEWEI